MYEQIRPIVSFPKVFSFLQIHTYKKTTLTSREEILHSVLYMLLGRDQAKSSSRTPSQRGEETRNQEERAEERRYNPPQQSLFFKRWTEEMRVARIIHSEIHVHNWNVWQKEPYMNDIHMAPTSPERFKRRACLVWDMFGFASHWALVEAARIYILFNCRLLI